MPEEGTETEPLDMADGKCAFSVIVNNYNYAKYLREALDSVLSQTCADLQLIVVDDGSTDGSCEIIDGYEDPRLTVIKKENAGQLSCFNAALPHVRGEVVCFLDADDFFEPGYLEALKEVYANSGCDYAFCNMRYVGAREGLLNREERRLVFSGSYYITRYTAKFLGGPTSSMSMKRELLSRILPLSGDETAWRICADAILVMGASLYDGRKCYIPQPLVAYRIHDSNFYMSADNADAEREKQKKTMIDAYLSRFPGEKERSWFPGLLREYFRSPVPSMYRRLMGDKLGLAGRLLVMAGVFVKGRSGFFFD